MTLAMALTSVGLLAGKKPQAKSRVLSPRLTEPAPLPKCNEESRFRTKSAVFESSLFTEAGKVMDSAGLEIIALSTAQQRITLV
jgi:hypothetical protein